jgi:hypothetical protein
VNDCNILETPFSFFSPHSFLAHNLKLCGINFYSVPFQVCFIKTETSPLPFTSGLALPTGAGGEDVAGNEAWLCIGYGLKQVCIEAMGFFKLTVSGFF